MICQSSIQTGPLFDEMVFAELHRHSKALAHFHQGSFFVSTELRNSLHTLLKVPLDLPLSKETPASGPPASRTLGETSVKKHPKGEDTHTPGDLEAIQNLRT